MGFNSEFKGLNPFATENALNFCVRNVFFLFIGMRHVFIFVVSVGSITFLNIQIKYRVCQ